MKKPRIAIITPGTFVIPSTSSSSVERVVYEWIRRLQPEIKGYVYGKKAPGYPVREKHAGVAYLRPKLTNRLGYLAAVHKRLRRKKYDLIQVENRPYFVRFLRKRHPKQKIWLSLHSLTFVSKRHLPHREMARCLRLADLIWVNSSFLKERLVKRFPALESRIVVNYLGVDQQQFISRWTAEGMALRERFLQKKGFEHRKIIVYVGRLLKIKGVHHLLQAMPEIIKREPSALLVIVGGAFYGSARTTPYVKHLYQLGKEFPDHVRFIPYVPHDEIQEWFRLADVVVVPSSANEAFGLVNVEAMATGVPVVATSSGGMKEIIVHGSTGFLLQPERLREELVESVVRLLADDLLRRLMGGESIRRVEEFFTWQHTANRWLARFQGEPKS